MITNLTKDMKQIYASKKIATKMKKSNNKKTEWYCSTSKSNLRRMLQRVVIPSLDIYRDSDTDYPIADASIKVLEEDILGFVNRECRAVRTEKNKGTFLF